MTVGLVGARFGLNTRQASDAKLRELCPRKKGRASIRYVGLGTCSVFSSPQYQVVAPAGTFLGVKSGRVLVAVLFWETTQDIFISAGSVMSAGGLPGDRHDLRHYNGSSAYAYGHMIYAPMVSGQPVVRFSVTNTTGFAPNVAVYEVIASSWQPKKNIVTTGPSVRAHANSLMTLLNARVSRPAATYSFVPDAMGDDTTVEAVKAFQRDTPAVMSADDVDLPLTSIRLTSWG